MSSLSYLTASTRKYLAGHGFECPSCGGSDSAVVDRKRIVTTLRRCAACKLLFRTPTTSVEENARIYQTAYSQGFTTELPGDAALAELKAKRFQGMEKDYRPILDVLAAVGGKAGDRLFDFGCSWGYGSWQMTQAGFRVDSFEISVPRRGYAIEKLGIHHVEPADAESEAYDFFFSSHVLEHVPSVSKVIDLGMRLLRPGGLFVAFTPNGGAEFQKANYPAFHQLWGFVHPQLLDPEFVRAAFPGKRYLVGSTPIDTAALGRFRKADPQVLPAPGDELLMIVEKPL